jgi:hypothetical protein
VDDRLANTPMTDAIQIRFGFSLCCLGAQQPRPKAHSSSAQVLKQPPP